MPIFIPLLFQLSDMYLLTLDGNLPSMNFLSIRISNFRLIYGLFTVKFLFIISSYIESAWNFNSDNIISEDSVYPTRGREDRGASRTPLPEIGFMLGSATAR